MTNRWWHIIRVGVGHWNLRGEGETRVQALVVSDGTKMRKNIVDYYAHWRGGGGVPLGVRKRGKIFFGCGGVGCSVQNIDIDLFFSLSFLFLTEAVWGGGGGGLLNKVRAARE